MGIPDDVLKMSVLLQELIPANYSFVLHTSDPITGEAGRIHGEMVVGMGETLVGNYPGRALSFVFQPSDGSIKITTYPSKTVALRCSQENKSMLILMARSDSNGEDLEEFAGAGLYSSVPIPIDGYQQISVSYAEEPLIWDDDFRTSMLNALVSLAQRVESIAGSPQDIEGVIGQDDMIYIVQTRPQVIS